MAILVGVDNILKEGEKRRQDRERSNIPTLYLRDGDRARIRFITDANSAARAYYHRVLRTYPSGKSFNEEIYCSQRDAEGVCDLCERNERAKIKIHFWLYVYSVLHSQQNKRLQIDETAQVWKKTKGGGYLEEVNHVVLWRSGVGKSDYILKSLANYNTKYGTLLDREYEISRLGGGLEDTVYNIVSEAPSKYPENLKAIVLPSLGDVIRGEVLTLVPEVAEKDKKQEVIQKKIEEEKMENIEVEEEEELF